MPLLLLFSLPCYPSLSQTHAYISNLPNNVFLTLLSLTLLCDEEAQLASDARTEEEQYCTRVSVIHHGMGLACYNDFFLDGQYESHAKLCVWVGFPYSKIMTPAYSFE